MEKIIRIHPELDAPAPFGRLLVVETDVDLRAMWEDLLTGAGYLVHVTASLGDALLLSDVCTFDLGLIHQYAEPIATSMMSTSVLRPYILRRRLAPTPVAIVSTAQSEASGNTTPFAFVLAMPFELHDLLGHIAAALDRPFPPERRWQQTTAIAFLERLGNDDWPFAPALLCTEDVTYCPPSPINPRWAAVRPVTAHHEIMGRDALSAYLRAIARSYRHLTCFDIRCYSLPRGVAARFTYTYELLDGQRHRETSALIFRFGDEAISHIGVRSLKRASEDLRVLSDG